MSTANIEQMRDAVREMDCMAQAAFSEISTFAKLALGLMENHALMRYGRRKR